MDETTRALRLAEWLQTPPGTDPPADVDLDVLAAVCTLAPDRAPSPRVTLDDILGSVREGPFAAPTTEGAAGFPEAEADGGKVLPFWGRGGWVDAPPAGADLHVARAGTEADAPRGPTGGAPSGEDSRRGNPVAVPSASARAPSEGAGAPAGGAPRGEPPRNAPPVDANEPVAIAPVAATDTAAAATEDPARPGNPVIATAADVVSLAAARAAGASGGHAAPPAAEPDAAHGRAPGRKRPSRFWMGPALGVAFAAAAAVLVALPMAGKLVTSSVAEQEAARVRSEAAARAEPPPPPARAAPAGIPEAATPAVTGAKDGVGEGEAVERQLAAAPAEPALAAPEPRRDAGMPAGEAPAGTASLDTTGFGGAGPGAGGDGALGRGTAAQRDDATVAAKPAARSASAPASSVATTRTSSTSAPTTSVPSTSAPATGGAWGTSHSARREEKAQEKAAAPRPVEQATGIAEMQAPSASPSRSAAPAQAAGAPKADASADAPARSSDAFAPAAESAALADEDALADDEVERGDAKQAEVAATRMKSEARKQKSTQAESASLQVPGASSNAATVSAAPLDYDAGWYRARPDLAAAYDAALAEERAGRWDTAAAAWRALVDTGDAVAAQDAAWRGGKALRNLGRFTEALALVDVGLRKSGANTPFLANLLVLRGEMLLVLGRVAEAQAAFSEAARLNAVR